MAEPKKLRTRMIQKHATAAVWNDTNFTPLQGEIIVYDPGYDSTDGITYDRERTKVGDGTHTVKELPFSVVTPDWNQNDETKADYVKNRTHYEETVLTTEIFYGSGTLEYDSADNAYYGSVETNLDISYEGPYEWLCYGTAKFKMVINDKVYFESDKLCISNLVDFVDVTIDASMFDFVPDQLDVQIYAYLEDTTVHKLDKKYLPDAVVLEDELTTALTTATKNLNTEINKRVKSINGKTPVSGAVTLTYNDLAEKPFYYHVEHEYEVLDNFDGRPFQFNEQQDGCYINFDRPSGLDAELSVYTPLNVTFDGVEYINVEVVYEDFGDDGNELRYCGDPEFIEYPFYIRTDAYGEIEHRIYTSTAGSHTIKITSTEKTEVKKINIKHIPNNIAHKDFVEEKVNSLVDTAPEALNTLNELSKALGDDPNFATTVLTEVGKKVDKEAGKGLSTNDFNNTYKKTLDTIKPGTGDNSIVINDGTAVGKGSIAGGTTDKSLVEGLLGLGSLLFDIEEAEAQADLSISFGANTKAVTAGSAAIGVGTQTGVKGYYWDTIDFNTNTIKLSKTRRTSSLIKPTYVTDFDWQVGDIISMVNVTNHTCTSVITAVNKSASTITVDRLPFDKIEYTTTLSVYTYTKPYDRSIYAVYQNSESDINTGSPRWAVRSGVVDIGFGGFTLGLMNLTSGNAGFNAGYNNWVAGGFGAALGRDNLSGYAALAEGWGTKAIGDAAHTENFQTEAKGFHAHAQGYRTKASSETQDVAGKYNIEDSEGKFAHILGNGTAENNRSNAHTVDWDGNAWYAGEITVGEDKKVLATEEALYREVNPAIANKVADIESVLDGLVYENMTAKATANTLNIPADAKGIGRLSKVGGYTYVKGDTNTFAHSDVTAIQVTNKDGSINKYTLPEEILTVCPDYGMGLNNEYYNYLDLESGKYYHRVTVLPKTDFGVLPNKWKTNYSNLVSVKDSQLKLRYEDDKLVTCYYDPEVIPDPLHGYEEAYPKYINTSIECNLTVTNYDNETRYFGLVIGYNNANSFIIMAMRMNGAGWIEEMTSSGWKSIATFNLSDYNITLEKDKTYKLSSTQTIDGTMNFYIDDVLLASGNSSYNIYGGCGIATKGVDLAVDNFTYKWNDTNTHISTQFDDTEVPSNGMYVEALDNNGVESYMVVGDGKSDLDDPISIVDLRKYIDINDFVIEPLEDVSNIRLVYKSGYITANELPCELKYLTTKEIIQKADDKLDGQSTNPVENRAIAVEFASVRNNIYEVKKTIQTYEEKTERRLKTVEAVINNGKFYEDKTATIDTLPYTVTEDVLPYAAVTKIGGYSTTKQRTYNIVKFPYTGTLATGSAFVSGVTFTVNSDASITLNGTATDDGEIELDFNFGGLNWDYFIMSGCPIQTDTHACLVLTAYRENYVLSSVVDTGNSFNSVLSSGEFSSWGWGDDLVILTLKIQQGDTYNNLTFYPQIVGFEDEHDMEDADGFIIRTVPYEPAGIVNNPVNKVYTGNSMFTIPDELIKACPDFGAGINSDYYNYIDLENGMYYENVTTCPKTAYASLDTNTWKSVLSEQYATAKSCNGYVALTETSGQTFNHLLLNDNMLVSSIGGCVSAAIKITDYLTVNNYFGVLPFYQDASHFLIVATRANGAGWIEFMTPSGWITLCNFNLNDFGITLEKGNTYQYRISLDPSWKYETGTNKISFRINNTIIVDSLEIPDAYSSYLHGYRGITSKGVNIDLSEFYVDNYDGYETEVLNFNACYSKPEGAFIDLGSEYLIPAPSPEQNIFDVSEYTHNIDNIIEIEQGGTITTEPNMSAVLELKYQVKI